MTPGLLFPRIHEDDTEKPTREIEQSRITLFELISFCLSSDGMSESQKQLLQYFSEIQGIDSDYFEDLVRQAQIIHKETQKTINLILE